MDEIKLLVIEYVDIKEKLMLIDTLGLTGREIVEKRLAFICELIRFYAIGKKEEYSSLESYVNDKINLIKGASYV